MLYTFQHKESRAYIILDWIYERAYKTWLDICEEIGLGQVKTKLDYQNHQVKSVEYQVVRMKIEWGWEMHKPIQSF